MSKFCRNCGAELKEGADVCVSCGKAVEAEATAVAQNNGPVQANPAKGKSVGALICGIASIVFSWVPYISFAAMGAGITAIVLGAKGRKGSPQGQTGMATAGLVLGIIGLCISTIWTICWICTCSVATSSVSDWEEIFNDVDWDY